MEKKFKKIAVIASGGDAPGMNNVIRAVTRSAIQHGVEVVGVKGGYYGLIHNEFVKLGARDVSNIINIGGTFLYSARCPEFKEEEGMQLAVKNCKENGIDGIIVCGGDGTFRGATDLSNRGIPTIGIPGTIDNDITATDYTIGYDTAMNTTVQMIDRLRDTCLSHARCNVVEVMGRDAGGIAINTAIACGAVGCMINEMPFDEEALMEKMRKLRAEGKRQFIVVVVEGNPHYSEAFAKRIEEATGIETKFARLAHVVRGGSPTLRDRVTAAKMSTRAVEELLAGKSDLVVCECGGKIVTKDINFALITDRMYKNKLKEGDLDKYSEEELAEMKATCEAKRQNFIDLYKIMDEISY